ncbi:mediator of RNA polymerase II transcription subunit 15-like [Gigantopelta aegis]|uniref:mediator of RNA polymerase II transcription subunit 15-like n=1 Tax=Gigantopelta aegis TaxID=1735272 RepID=UPI001B88BFC7|nr:mediator of RNA polymerase II transcription subunit 15-like [Gigantopelta aegis]XP_041348125.1 mediator of RNA polymerase II transcription subunit 15-like [Gigantopelta aegis]XP_041348126.1 mediator of RNA polymerase II transcription subunit 15-like [Gigantopelta aegis]XP_041348127.1 mediator of RNA polymerase II transcription subunit 15-like [Gigantopelta aegis]XP_041348128.1 mediator of RNA polymerase II transcription subunit 15-like [Gigantopelta aegis]
MAFSLGHSDDTAEWIDKIFRERIVAQIEQARSEAILQDGARSSEDMENFIYGSAKSREEYMALIAQLVMSLRETTKKQSYEPESDNSMNEQVNGTSNGDATEEERKS